jgi:hypothetical protein
MPKAALPVESQELVKSRMGTTGIRLKTSKTVPGKRRTSTEPLECGSSDVMVEVNGTNNDDFNPDDGSNSLKSSDGAKRARYSTSAYSPKHSTPA